MRSRTCLGFTLCHWIVQNLTDDMSCFYHSLCPANTELVFGYGIFPVVRGYACGNFGCMANFLPVGNRVGVQSGRQFLCQKYHATVSSPVVIAEFRRCCIFRELGNCLLQSCHPGRPDSLKFLRFIHDTYYTSTVHFCQQVAVPACKQTTQTQGYTPQLSRPLNCPGNFSPETFGSSLHYGQATCKLLCIEGNNNPPDQRNHHDRQNRLSIRQGYCGNMLCELCNHRCWYLSGEPSPCGFPAGDDGFGNDRIFCLNFDTKPQTINHQRKALLR